MGRNYKIAVMGGDGTGPEVAAEGIKVLQAAASKFGFSLSLTDFDYGGDRYLKTGEVLPENAAEELSKHDAIFLGAIGHPDVKPGILEKGILLSLRFALDQYVNLRPVILYPNVDTPLKDKGPEDIDFVVVRENTEGLYAGAGGVLKKELLMRLLPRSQSIPAKVLRDAFDLPLNMPGKETRKKLLHSVEKPMCLRLLLISGNEHSMKLQRSIRTLRLTTPMSMQHACGWSRILNGSMLLSPIICSAISSPILVP